MRTGFLIKHLIVTCLIAATLRAQAPIRPDLEKLIYPALAISARIQGTVKFTVKHGEIQLVSGHPMLLQVTKGNLQMWAPSQIPDEFEVIYIFRLTRIDSIEKEEPIGDPVSRTFRRLFHMPTTRVVKVDDCTDKGSVKSFRAGSEGDRPIVEITIEAQPACIQVQYSASSKH